MKLLLRLTIAIFITLTIIPVATYAQEHGTPDDAKQMVQNGLAHIKEVGLDRALADFNLSSGKWHNKDIYLYCYRFDGTNLCSGANKALVGKNMIDVKYPDGQLHVKKMIEIARSKGSGWDEYPWAHPVTKKLENKKTFIARVPGYDVFIAAGAYNGAVAAPRRQ